MMKQATLLLIALIIGSLLRAQSAEYSMPSGRYPLSFHLAITPSPPTDGCSIHYTTNGFDPTAASPTYTSPLYLDSSCLSGFPLFSVQNAPDTIWHPPLDIEHIIVVKAALFDSLGCRRGNIATASYIIQPLLGRDIELPIMSLCIDSTDLLSYDSGIFVPGFHFDASDPRWTGNYYQSGIEWEKPAHLDYLLPGSPPLSQRCGIRTHGGNSRRMMQKGFSLYAREEYGTKSFKYPFFNHNATSKYKRLVLKPLCSAWTDAGIQDWLCQMMAASFGFDHLSVQPIVLFINGEYWGIYLLEEKPDQHYVDNHYGYDHDEVDLMGNWFGLLENGSANDFLSMMEQLKSVDLSNEETYQAITSLINLEAFAEYQLFEMFVGNDDWPSNNMRCWSYHHTPWQWLFYDGDACFTSTKAIDNAFCDEDGNSWPTNGQSTLLFRKLCENDNFVSLLFEKMEQLFDKLHYSSVIPMIDSAQNYLADEITHNIARFGYPTTYSQWLQELSNIRSYLLAEPDVMRGKLSSHLWSHEPAINNASIYPSPMCTRATIKFESNQAGFTNIKIFNIKGSLLFHRLCPTSVGTNLFDIDIHLPDGIYIVLVGDKAITQTVVCK